jgi:hypothetical protein
MAKLIYYDSHENCALGHGKLLEENDNMNLLLHKAREYRLYHDERLTIASKDYEGYIGELTIDKNSQKTVTLDDMWLYPDPNYRGDADNSFYGTVAEYRAEKDSPDMELD